MGKRKRKVPGINGSSSADIAFMLLLFFLLTTSMDTDQGLPRQLPPPPEQKKEQEELRSLKSTFSPNGTTVFSCVVAR